MSASHTLSAFLQVKERVQQAAKSICAAISLLWASLLSSTTGCGFIIILFSETPALQTDTSSSHREVMHLLLFSLRQPRGLEEAWTSLDSSFENTADSTLKAAWRLPPISWTASTSVDLGMRDQMNRETVAATGCAGYRSVL